MCTAQLVCLFTYSNTPDISSRPLLPFVAIAMTTLAFDGFIGAYYTISLVKMPCFFWRKRHSFGLCRKASCAIIRTGKKEKLGMPDRISGIRIATSAVSWAVVYALSCLCPLAATAEVTADFTRTIAKS